MFGQVVSDAGYFGPPRIGFLDSTNKFLSAEGDIKSAIVFKTERLTAAML